MSTRGAALAGRRVSFWVAVGGVAILANFAVELAAERFPNLGLKRFTTFTHLGGQ